MHTPALSQFGVVNCITQDPSAPRSPLRKGWCEVPGNSLLVSTFNLPPFHEPGMRTHTRSHIAQSFWQVREHDLVANLKRNLFSGRFPCSFFSEPGPQVREKWSTYPPPRLTLLVEFLTSNLSQPSYIWKKKNEESHWCLPGFITGTEWTSKMFG